MQHKSAEKIIMFFIGFLAITVIGIFISRVNKPPAMKISGADYHSGKEITVELSGEAKHPGTYSVAAGTTVHELLYIAGGIAKDGEPSSVDLDAVLYEDCRINIGKKTEYDTEVVVGYRHNDADGKCNINSASADELARLDDIGAKIAEEIVRYREENGDFEKPEDIMNVDGIGEKKYNKIKDHITV